MTPHIIINLTKSNCLENQLLEIQLRLIANTTVSCCNIDELLNNTKIKDVDLVIIDYNYMAELKQNDQLPNFDLLQLHLLIHNVPDPIPTKCFLNYHTLKGVLTQSASIDHLMKSVEYVLAGGLWFPRRVLETMIFYLRNPNDYKENPFDLLSERERQVLNLLIQGESNHEIAEQLFLSECTVKTHVYNLFKKLKVHRRAEAIKIAKQGHSQVQPNHASSDHAN